MFGGSDKAGNKTGTAFEGTAFERKVDLGRNLNDYDYSARIVFDGIRQNFEDFTGVITDLARDVASDIDAVNLPGKANSIDDALGRLLNVDDVKSVNRYEEQAQQVAEKYQQSFSQIVDIALSVTLAGVQRVTDAQAQFRAIEDQFSGKNKLILKDLGYTGAQVERARNTYIAELVQGFEESFVQTLIDAGQATRADLDKWRKSEIGALREGQAAAVATAREIGAATGPVIRAYEAEMDVVREEYREMLKDMVNDTAGARERIAALQAEGGMMQTLATSDRASYGDVQRLLDNRRELPPDAGRNQGGPARGQIDLRGAAVLQRAAAAGRGGGRRSARGNPAR